MKKLLVALTIVLAMGLMGSVYAQNMEGYANERFYGQFSKANEMTAEGTVVSHDVSCHCIVLQTANGNVVLQDDYASFNQDYNRVKGLKIGSRAKVTYKTVDFINYATKVEQ